MAILYGTKKHDLLTGTSLADHLFGDDGDDSLFGGGGNDSIHGGTGDDTLEGGAGDDLLSGGSGADSMNGGLGDDIYVVDNVLDIAREITVLSGGVDEVQSSVSIEALGAGIENLTLLGVQDLNGSGNKLDNLIVGNTGDNELSGGRGADTLLGGDGRDKLDGGDDADMLQGGAGNDDLRGGYGKDTLVGGAGADTLDGQSDRDTMYGGEGDDTYVVDDKDDVAMDIANGKLGGGIDTVLSWADFFTLDASSFIENLTLQGYAYSGAGNALDNLILGNKYRNVLFGEAGNDRLFGGDGEDYLYGGPGSDTLVGGPGVDSLYGGSKTFKTLDRDTFVFASAGDADGDWIGDFNTGRDTINLGGIDANWATQDVNESFTYIAEAAFDSQDATGQLRFEHSTLYGSNDADAEPEFMIFIAGVATLSAFDLVL